MKVLNKFRLPLGTRRRTGEVCPETGVWKAMEPTSPPSPLKRGDILPPYTGKRVTWMLVHYV